MKFTVSLPIGGPIHNVSEISTLATKADQLGFDAVTASERIIMPRNIKSKYPTDLKAKYQELVLVKTPSNSYLL